MISSCAAILIAAKHGELTKIRDCAGIAYTVGTLRCNFDFRTTDWDYTTRTAVFCKGNVTTHPNIVDNAIGVILDKDDECAVPPEVLLPDEKYFSVGVWGVTDEGLRIVSEWLVFRIKDGCYVNSTESIPPTPTVYEQIMIKLNSKASIEHKHDDEYYSKEYIDNITIPTKVSELENDAGYLKTIPSEYVTESEIEELTDAVLNKAKQSGEFDGADGLTPYIAKNGNWWIGITDTGVKAQGNDGVIGKDGVSATHKWDGTTLTITSASGTSSANLKGERGDNGYTPQKGVDYYTEADKSELIAQIESGDVTLPYLPINTIQDIDMSNHRIINVATPIDDNDVANKSYVDQEIATFDFIKIVDDLPTEGLTNRLYLVPKMDTQTQDLFDEYIWTDKGWEWITTKQVEVDLTDYVKNTDYATRDKAGVVKVRTEYGFYCTNGMLTVRQANKGEIDAKTNQYASITPGNLEYAVKSVGDGYYATEDAVFDNSAFKWSGMSWDCVDADSINIADNKIDISGTSENLIIHCAGRTLGFTYSVKGFSDACITINGETRVHTFSGGDFETLATNVVVPLTYMESDIIIQGGMNVWTFTDMKSRTFKSIAGLEEKISDIIESSNVSNLTAMHDGAGNVTIILE